MGAECRRQTLGRVRSEGVLNAVKIFRATYFVLAEIMNGAYAPLSFAKASLVHVT
jgi:hypothetical protein